MSGLFPVVMIMTVVVKVVVVIKVVVMVAAAVTMGGKFEDYHDSNNDSGALKTNLTEPTPLPNSGNT